MCDKCYKNDMDTVLGEIRRKSYQRTLPREDRKASQKRWHLSTDLKDEWHFARQREQPVKFMAATKSMTQ